MRTVQILLATAAVLLIPAVLVAQDAQPQKKKGRAGRLTPAAQALMRIDRMREALDGMDLTAEQKEQLNAIREELGPKMKEAFEKIQEILTEEQQSIATQAMQEARDAGKKGRQLFLAIESAMNYTDEQKEKLAEVGKPMMKLQNQLMKKVLGILTSEQRETLKKTMAPQKKKAAKKAAKKKAAKKKEG
jgi:hypothetical protein